MSVRDERRSFEDRFYEWLCVNVWEHFHTFPCVFRCVNGFSNNRRVCVCVFGVWNPFAERRLFFSCLRWAKKASSNRWGVCQLPSTSVWKLDLQGWIWLRVCTLCSVSGRSTAPEQISGRLQERVDLVSSPVLMLRKQTSVVVWFWSIEDLHWTSKPYMHYSHI